jgi:hypothetical protein
VNKERNTKREGKKERKKERRGGGQEEVKVEVRKGSIRITTKEKESEEALAENKTMKKIKWVRSSSSPPFLFSLSFSLSFSLFLFILHSRFRLARLLVNVDVYENICLRVLREESIERDPRLNVQYPQWKSQEKIAGETRRRRERKKERVREKRED